MRGRDVRLVTRSIQDFHPHMCNWYIDPGDFGSGAHDCLERTFDHLYQCKLKKKCIYLSMKVLVFIEPKNTGTQIQKIYRQLFEF